MNYHRVDPSLPRALRRALHRAERRAATNGHSIRPWRSTTPSPHATVYTSACYKCAASVEVLHLDHGAGIRPTVVVTHRGTEKRVQHPWLSGW
jgi:hypothetical protein